MSDSAPTLLSPLKFLKGVGPQRAELLSRIGILRPVDLLFYFPRDYQDMTRFCRIDDLADGELQTVLGRVLDIRMRRTRRGPLVTVEFTDGGHGVLEALWFNQPWIAQNLAVDQRYLILGKPTCVREGYFRISHPKLIRQSRFEADGIADATGESPETEPNESPVSPAAMQEGTPLETVPPFLPIYPLTEGLQQFQLHRIIRPLLETLPDTLDEVFPPEFLTQHKLLPIATAVREIHFPSTREAADAARRRFVYQELFLLQLALSIRRTQHEVNLKAPELPATEKIATRIRRLLPFDLTDAQNRVIGEISADLAKPVPMNRLLQGDVASGKTVVAVWGMLQTVAAGHQAVLMAPTEILARQHLRNLERLLVNSRVRIAGLFGGQSPRERREILDGIERGQIDLVVGTQAILYSDATFHRLGLVVIDEQHKFGVFQRARLKTETDFDPHYLVMTATPIPRSVAMTAFGDLDLSVLDGMPPGRQPTRTYVVEGEKQGAWWDFFRKKLRQGGQGYVIVPRVDETTDEELHSTQSAFEALSCGELAGFALGVIHGRMSPEEKERVMLDFRSGTIRVLISTTVVEVGVDIPNATLMAILNADRFGLAALHQLRGRIGRGKFPGFCGVFRSTNLLAATDTANNATPDTASSATESSAPHREESPDEKGAEKISRLDLFAKSADGFELAEKDFALRGPGEFFGTRQHGAGFFRVADLIRDQAILLEARADAKNLVAADPGLASPEHHALRRQMLKRYGSVLELGDVG